MKKAQKKLKKHTFTKCSFVVMALALVFGFLVYVAVIRSNTPDVTPKSYKPYTYSDCIRDFGIKKPEGERDCRTNDGKKYSDVPNYEERLDDFIDCVNEFGYYRDNKHRCFKTDTRLMVTKPFSEIVNTYSECETMSHDPRLLMYPGTCTDPKTGRVFTQDKD